MARALVTGSAGFIGGHLVAELTRQGWEVEGADLKDGIDLSWPDEVRNLPDVDTVFHLAAMTGVRRSVDEPLTCQRYNVLATVNVLQWCIERGINKVVFASSSSIYGDCKAPFLEEQEPCPMSPYAASKVAGEALCHAYHKLYGMDIAVLRYFTVYGPNGRKDMAVGKFLAALRNDELITIYGDGSQRRDFTYVGDVVKTTIEAANWDGWNVVNVGCGNPVGVLNMISILEELTGKMADIKFEERNKADVPVTWANTDRLCELMDWSPIPLKGGLRLTVGR